MWQGKLDLFDLGYLLLFARFFFLLVALESELSVVHDPAHRRLTLRCNEDEIETPVVCRVLRVLKRHDAELFTGQDRLLLPALSG